MAALLHAAVSGRSSVICKCHRIRNCRNIFTGNSIFTESVVYEVLLSHKYDNCGILYTSEWKMSSLSLCKEWNLILSLIVAFSIKKQIFKQHFSWNRIFPFSQLILPYLMPSSAAFQNIYIKFPPPASHAHTKCIIGPMNNIINKEIIYVVS